MCMDPAVIIICPSYMSVMCVCRSRPAEDRHREGRVYGQDQDWHGRRCVRVLQGQEVRSRLQEPQLQASRLRKFVQNYEQNLIMLNSSVSPRLYASLPANCSEEPLYATIAVTSELVQTEIVKLTNYMCRVLKK